MSRRIWTKPFVKTVLSGDQRKARSLERRARSYVGYLFDQMGDRQKHRAGNWNLRDGAKITAFAWNDTLGKRALVRIFHPLLEEEIILEYEYGMESGLLKLPTSFELGEDSTTSGTLYPLSAQQTLNSYTEDQLLDKYLGEQQFEFRDYSSTSLESKSIGIETNINKKQAILQMRPWEFTGKFALAVKAHFSSFNKELSSFLKSIKQYRYIEGSGAIPESRDLSFFLYTIELGSYILGIKISGSVKLYKFVPKVEHTALVKDIKDIIETNLWIPGDKEYQRYETYILSMCDISGSSYTKVFGEADGTPIFYGWKPSWGGKYLSIVTLLRSRYSGDTQLPIEARLYTCEVSYNDLFEIAEPLSVSNDPLSFSINEVENKSYVPRFNVDTIYYPYYIAPQASLFWFPWGCDENDPEAIEQRDVPLYCWYSCDNELVVARYSRNLDENYTTTYPDILAWRAAQHWYSSSTSHSSTERYSTGGYRATLSFETLAAVDDEDQYYEPNYKTSSLNGRVSGLSSTSTTTWHLDWSGSEITDCDNWDGECGSYPTICTQDTTFFTGLTRGPLFEEWDMHTVEELGDDYPCYENNSNNLKPQLQEVNTHYYKSGASSNSSFRTCLVISSYNAESAFILGNQRENIVNTTKFIFAKSGLAAYQSCIDNTQNCHYYGFPGLPGSGAGCDTQYYNTSNEYINIAEVTVSSLYGDKWGQIAYADKTLVADPTETIEPDGLYLLFNNPVCGDGPYEFTGYFLTLASTEGLKFYQKNPGNLTYQNIDSNFGEPWDLNSNLKIFAGWQ